MGVAADKESSSSSARRAAPAPLARSFWRGIGEFLRALREVGGEIGSLRGGARVTEQDGFALPRTALPRGAPSAAALTGAALTSAEQRQRERPFQLEREHRVGESRCEEFALPCPAGGRQRAPRELVAARRREGRQPIAVDAGHGGFDRGVQRLIAGNVQRLGGAFDLGTPSGRGCRRQRAPGQQPTSRRSPVGPRAGEMEDVAQRRFVLAAAGPRNAGGGAERQTLAPDAEPGRVFTQRRVEAGERGAGEKCLLRLGFRRISGARPSGERSYRGRCNGWDSRRISAIEHAETVLQNGAFGYREPNKAPRLSRALYIR